MFLRWILNVVLKNSAVQIICFILLFSQFSISAHAYSQQEFNAVMSGDEKELENVRNQEINQLRIVMGRRFVGSRKPDLLLRLAEIYVEKYRFYFLKENEIFEKNRERGSRQKYVNHDRSKQHLQQSIRACLSILKSKVRFSKMDQVYYFLGYNHEELEKKSKAAYYYNILVKKYPSSQYAPEAYRVLGEYAFQKNKYRQSVSFLQKATRFQNVPSYPRTLYKLAWAYFKIREKKRALNTMKQVIQIAKKDDKFIGLQEEALNDIVLFFSEAGQYSDAKRYFSSISGGDEMYSAGLDKLSQTYARQGRHKQAIAVNNILLKEFTGKKHDLTFDVLARQVEAYRKTGSSSGEQNALKQLVRYFAEHSNDIDSDSAKETYERTKKYLRNRATQVHKRAQKTTGRSKVKLKRRLYSDAADLYGLYLQGFFADPDTDAQKKELSEIRIYRADCLLASNRNGEAIGELQKTLKEGGSVKYQREAGTTLLNLLIRNIDHTKGIPSESLQNQFLEAAELFEDQFPTDKLIPELHYKKARLEVLKSGSKGYSNNARSELKKFIEKYPHSKRARISAQDLVEDALKKNMAEDAVDLANEFLASEQLMGGDKDKKLRLYLKSTISRNSFSKVKKLENSKAYEDAAEEYEKLAALPANDAEVTFKALNNAGVNYEKANSFEKAYAVYEKMISKYKNKNIPKEGLKRIASAHVWESKFSTAAKYYEKLAHNGSYNGSERLSFAKTAFWLHLGMGETDASQRLMQYSMQTLCGSFKEETCHTMVMEQAKSYAKSDKKEELNKTLKDYLRRAGKQAHEAEAYFRMGEYHEASQSSGARSKRKADASERNYGANAAFLMVAPKYEAFESIRLELPEDELKKKTQLKLQALEKLVGYYQNVIGYGDAEWGIAALERISNAFIVMARDLRSAPIPTRFNTPQLQAAYRKEIESVARPMIARGLDLLKQGLSKGLASQVTSESFIALTRNLSAKIPDKYPPAHYLLKRKIVDDEEPYLQLAGPIKTIGDEWRIGVANRLHKSPKSAMSWVELGNIEAINSRLLLAELFYEQALQLDSKSEEAHNNLAVIRYLNNEPMGASVGFAHAVRYAKDKNLYRANFGKILLRYHHYASAKRQLAALGRSVQSNMVIQGALACAMLGSGDVNGAMQKLKNFSAEDSKRFVLWYNWSVGSIIRGGSSHKEKTHDIVENLDDRRGDYTGVDRLQIETAIGLGKSKE